jgi:hypothetical protein
MLHLTDLIGFGAGGAAPPKLSDLAFHASATSTASTLSAPVTILPGDLLVFIQNCGASSAPAAAAPFGFTQITTSNGSTARAVMSYKIATGVEAGGNLGGMTGTVYHNILLVFRGNIPITAAVPASAANQTTDTAPANQVVSAASGLAPLVVLALWARGIGDTTVRGFTPAADAEVKASNQLYAKYKIYDSAPADTTCTMPDDGTQNILHSCYIACS